MRSIDLSLTPARRAARGGALALAALLALGVALPAAQGQARLNKVEYKAPQQNEFTSAAGSEEQPTFDPSNFYDAANPDYYKLQQSSEVAALLPLDKKGAIDWMTALRGGKITPRASLNGEQKMQVLDLDIVMRNTKEMPHVKFPHNSHTQWLACSNCHDKIFVPKAGANEISMTKIFAGQFCGACHDRVAFLTTYSCERCHSVPHGDVKAWW